jgi:polyisoprenoid-binding protein YceI
MKRGIPLFLLLGASAFSAEYSLQLKPENTKIEWTAGAVMHTVRGTFRLESGEVHFDPATGKASGRVAIDVASGQSGSEARDRRMHASVLESKKYPEAVFVPDRIEGKLDIPGSSEVEVHGVFTIHGAPHELTMDANTQVAGDAVKADLTFVIPYIEGGMKDPGNFLLRVDKKVAFAVTATGTLIRR